jgi:hypothetical protein
VAPFHKASLVKSKMIPGEWERARTLAVRPQETSRLPVDPRVTLATVGPIPMDVWHRPGLPRWVKVSILVAVLLIVFFLDLLTS